MQYKNKKILIIGGTGTVGKRLAREILKQDPAILRVFSRDEYKQFVMKSELEEKKNIRFLVGDVRDYDRVERACRDIDIIFNLAAMKHVPACEYNPTEAIKTNVVGMENVVKAARYNNVEKVIFTSSDKAICPTNVYGATKLLAERLVQAANTNKGSSRTKFVAVRFGNVMGSRGSVIPLFKKQILDRKVVTLTNGEMSRFMMTLSQAVKLTLDVAEKAIGGEIFILKMPVIKMSDLTQVVVEEMSNKYDIEKESIYVSTIGERPGEKFYEELMTIEESRLAFDLGEYYAVFPVTHEFEKYKEHYNEYKRARIGSYSSNGVDPISMEMVRELVKNEGLL